MLVAIVSGLFAIGATLLGVALTQGPEPVARGNIDSPPREHAVKRAATVTGTLSRVPDGQHVWLAVQRSGGLFFIGDEVARKNRRWARTLPAGLPPGQSFSLMLLLVGGDGDGTIRRWRNKVAIEERAREPSARPPLDAQLLPIDDLSDRAILDLTPGLVIPVPPSGRPVESVFRQARESRGVDFEFTNGGGQLTATFTPAGDCHRQHLSTGLRLEWKMSGTGSGGWGVQWSSKGLGGRFDASRFSRVVFHLKGVRGGEKFQIGLKDTTGTEVKLESKDRLVTSATEWGEFVVPLAAFRGVDRKRVENLNLGFNRAHGAGALCVDEIVFVS